MMYLILLLLCAAVCTEAVVEIVVKSNIFEPVRKFLEKRNSFLFQLVSCGHCFSMWASLLVVSVFFIGANISIEGVSNILLFPVGVILVHRVSNYLHMFIDRYVDKFYLNT